MINSTGFIWRLQSGQSGTGPYTCGAAMNHDGNYYGEYHPGPTCSENIDINKAPRGFLFGFDSIIAARRWWCSIHDLKLWEEENEMVLVAYREEDCSHLQRGRNQVIFVPKHTARVFKTKASNLHLEFSKDLYNRAYKFLV